MKQKDRDFYWGLALSLLKVLANEYHHGYQILALATVEDHHEDVLKEILPDGVTTYDPDNNKYSDQLDE